MRELVQQAERAFAAGQRAESAGLLARAQALAPDHPLVLNAAAVQELHRGDVQAARRLIEQAIAKDAGHPSFWINLATICRRTGAPDDEMKALERALALEPRHLLALLQRASLLELQGRPRAAAAVYQNALQTIPPGAQLPPSLRTPLERAAEAVRANDAALETFFTGELRELRAVHADASFARFDHAIDALLGKRRIYTQHPTLLHFPKLPAEEFYDRALFPWLVELEAATPEIRAEFERIFVEDTDQLEPYIAYPEGVPLDQWAELNHSRRWSVFYLWRDGRAIPEHTARCPQTTALLRTLPLSDVPGHSPTVQFSILDAKSHIPPHTGVTNTRLVVHVPLVIPAGCRFRVGSETREWQPGTAWVFDDTIEHEAWNDSDVPRAILMLDVWNPYLTPAERELVSRAVHALGEYNKRP